MTQKNGDKGLQLNTETPAVKSVFDMIAEMHSGTCDNINFIDISNYTLSPEKTLESVGIKFDSVLRFTDETIKGLAESGYTMASAGGFTIHFMADNSPKSAVFLSSAPEGITKEESPYLFWTLQTIFLHHELMHAKDMQTGKNFNLSTMKVDLVKAEVYADTKTLRFFDDMAKAGGSFFRDIYAAGVIGRKKTPIYVRIFNGIKKTFPEARLRAWASNSAIPAAE